MNNSTLKNILGLTALSISMGVSAQSNVMTFKALPLGSEGETKYTDSSPVTIEEGVPTTPGSEHDDWSVEGSVSVEAALNMAFSIEFGGIKTINAEAGDDFGKLITAGGIDRNSTGNLGVRGGKGGGLDP